MPSYGQNAGVQCHQGFGAVPRNSSRVMAPPGGASSGVFCNDVSMLQMQSSPAPQRRVLSGAQRKPQYADQSNNSSHSTALQPAAQPRTIHTNSGQYTNVFQNDTGMAMAPKSIASQQSRTAYTHTHTHNQPTGDAGYGNIFQNDVSLAGRPPRQPQQQRGYENQHPNQIMMNDMQMQQQNMAKAAGPATVGGGRAAEWLSNGQGRTVAPSPVPTRRVVGTRVGSANGQREGVEMSGLMRISSNVASIPPSQQPAAPTAYELREQEKEAFLTERAAQLQLSKENLARQQQNPMGRSVLAGESLSGLLLKADLPEQQEPQQQQQQYAQHADAPGGKHSFGGTLKGTRPKSSKAKGAPRCAQPKARPGPAAKPAAPLQHSSHLGGKAPEAIAARKAASARSRSTASARGKKVAASKAGVPQKLRINAGRTSSRVLAPPGGKSSISFGN